MVWGIREHMHLSGLIAPTLTQLGKAMQIRSDGLLRSIFSFMYQRNQSTEDGESVQSITKARTPYSVLDMDIEHS